MLDDALESALRTQNQPAIAGRIGRAHAEHHDRRIVRRLATLEHALQGRGRDERCVAIDHQHIAGETLENIARAPDSVAGTELLGLEGDAMGRDLLLDRVHARRDHRDDARQVQRRKAVEHMADQGPAADPVHDLREVGFHARALAGGEDDGGSVEVWHGRLWSS